MRIAFLTPLWPVSLAQNGIATYVDTMRRALENKGHECVILAMRTLDDELRDPGLFPVGRPPRGFAETQINRVRAALSDQYFDYDYGRRRLVHTLIEAHRQKPIDIFEAEESFGLPLTSVGATSAPVVIRSHGPHFLVKQPPHQRPDLQRIAEERRAYEAADAASFPSGALRDAVSSRYGLNFPVCAAYPNPIDIAPANEGWTLDGCDRNTILFVGRFDSLKGADLALKAFDAALERFPQARLVMAGADHGVDGPDGTTLNFPDFIAANLSERARSRIEFLGRVPRENIPGLRRQALISLSASRYETFPYDVTEALALGAPTVTSATPGLSEYLVDGEETLFAPVGDAASLQARIEQCLANPDYAAQIGAAGRRAAERMFAPEAIADAALGFFEQVIEAAQRRKAAQP